MTDSPTQAQGCVYTSSGSIPITCPYCEAKFEVRGANTTHYPVSKQAMEFAETLKGWPLCGSIILHPDIKDFNQRAICLLAEELVAAGMGTIRRAAVTIFELTKESKREGGR